MMIMDFSQVIISSIMAQIGNHTNAELEENMLRHMTLNCIRANKVKFQQEYGELVIAIDNKNYWRRDLFPYYKASRKKSQAASELNWKEIYAVIDKIKNELKEYFPYRVVDVDKAEADDVIGVLCKEFGNDNPLNYGERILIISGDKDFIQLQRYGNVRQYDPIRGIFRDHNAPDRYLMEHIIKGDSGDGIPNFLSDDNCLVVGVRQKSVMSKKLEQWLTMKPEEFCDENTMKNFKRNTQLIDLTMIPENISKAILESYHSQKGKKSNNLMNYFMVHRLKQLTEHLQEFM